jgi:hypothetical protein
MASQMVRINSEDHAALAEMAKSSGKSMTETLSEAVRLLRANALIQQTNEAYARLKADPKAWKEVLVERALWETTLSDGLRDGE